MFKHPMQDTFNQIDKEYLESLRKLKLLLMRIASRPSNLGVTQQLALKSLMETKKIERETLGETEYNHKKILMKDMSQCKKNIVQELF